MTISSAKRRRLRYLPFTFILVFDQLSLWNIFSWSVKNSFGDMLLPCLTPFSMSMFTVIIYMENGCCIRVDFFQQINIYGSSISCLYSDLNIVLSLIEPNAFFKSIQVRHNGISYSPHRSMTCMLSIVLYPILDPTRSVGSAWSIVVSSRLVMIFVSNS